MMPVNNILALLVLLCICITQTLAQVKFCDLYPPEVQGCFKEAHKHPVHVADAHEACIRKFYIDTEPDNNLTLSDRQFFDLRVKNNFGKVPPSSGPRIRREYRRLLKEDRIRLHNAFNVLYQNGIVGRFARLHATASSTIHSGAAFLGWHRVFIADFEEELRHVDPGVALAYWDSTLDTNMTRPSDSVVWSPCFFGNGNGTIKYGPFRGWYGGRSGPIQRDYARDDCDAGRLMSKNDISRLLDKCHLQDILSTENEECNLEVLHDGIHVWTGGDMGDLMLSAFDPIFYFHHAFVDYVWELFRRNQELKCDVDPESDYPADMNVETEGHMAFDRMHGYEHLKNIDGLSHIFTRKFYKYETMPSCPDCGSPYLYCDVRRQVCVSRDKSSCQMVRNARGQHTYTGLTSIGMSVDGPPSLTPFHNKHPFKGLPGDGRSRDMIIGEAHGLHKGGPGSRMPFSPLLPMMPSIPGSYGGERPSELLDSVNNPWIQNHRGSAKMAGRKHSQGFGPMAPGFLPFGNANSLSKGMSGMRSYLPFPNRDMNFPGSLPLDEAFQKPPMSGGGIYSPVFSKQYGRPSRTGSYY